ncbi:30S ribosomal protein S16 [Candidatus Aerophobetes bacterium]|nr:30S ribosomal protein S16 [Candidatus Aerophobetes bacterium]
MSTRIRLRREGAKKVPFYRIVVVDSHVSPKGKFIEKLGWYNPRSKEIQVDKEKTLKWMKRGAKLSNSLRKIVLSLSIFSREELISG